MARPQDTVTIKGWRVVVEMLTLAANALLAGLVVSATAALFVVWLANVG